MVTAASTTATTASSRTGSKSTVASHDNHAAASVLGWGPAAKMTLPVVPFVVPFASAYARSDRLGCVVDWTLPPEQQQHQQLLSQQRSGHHHGHASAALHARAKPVPAATDDTAAFAMVESVRSSSARKPHRPPMRGSGSGRSFGTGSGGGAGHHGTFRPRGGQRRIGWGHRIFDKHQQRLRQPSFRIDSSWRLVEEIEFGRLARLALEPEETPALLASIGSLAYFDKSVDKISTKNDRPVVLEEASLPRHLPVSKDPIFKILEERREGNVFVTDVVAALLMACPRTINPWDIVIRRSDSTPGVLYIEKRDESTVDLVLINETASEPPTEDREHINSVPSLLDEASRINAIIPRLLASKGNENKVNLTDMSPLSSSAISTSSSEDRSRHHHDDLAALERSWGPPPHNVYRYHKMVLGDDLVVVVRSQINGISRTPKATDQLLLIKALLEYDPKASGLDWRQRLDNQRSAVLANEIKNNSALMARWLFQAVLAQVDLLKLAYVARASPKDRIRHVLLGVHDYEPSELATQMNLNLANGFAILKVLVDMCRRLPAHVAECLVMRDPNKPIIRLYAKATAAEDGGDAEYDPTSAAFDGDDEIPVVEDVLGNIAESEDSAADQF